MNQEFWPFAGKNFALAEGGFEILYTMHRFQYKAYRRSFARGFSNAREQFPKREGLLVRVEDKDGRVGFGEAAPIESFGSESFPACLSAAASLEEKVEFEPLLAELSTYPAFRFACESALVHLGREGRWPEPQSPWPVCGLWSNTEDRSELESLIGMHYSCVKLKIGKRSLREELGCVEDVIGRSDGTMSIRLDANGSLTVGKTKEWLEALSDFPNIEFLEQPLAVGEEDEMRRLAGDFAVPIALDESVTRVGDLKRWRDSHWPGVLVIKPSLNGAYGELVDELRQSRAGCVFSSSLETMVGAANALALVLDCGAEQRALGFGVEALFADRSSGLEIGPFLQKGMLPTSDDLERFWNRI